MIKAQVAKTMNASSVFHLGDIVVSADYGAGRVTGFNVDGEVTVSCSTGTIRKKLSGITEYRTEKQHNGIGAESNLTPIAVSRPYPKPKKLPKKVSETLHDRERIVETLGTWADQSEAVITEYRRNMEEWQRTQRQCCQSIREARNQQIRSLQAKNEEMVASYEECIALAQTRAEQWIAEKETVVSDARRTMHVLREEYHQTASAPPHRGPCTSNPPVHLCCPITLQLMDDPVVASDGHTYERSAIEVILRRRNPRSPMTNDPFVSTMVFPNVTQRGMSRSWREEHGK